VLNYLSLGPTPNDEPCAQVGQDNYAAQVRKECRAYINQLTRQLGELPDSCSFATKSFPHDFGGYREVIINFDEDDNTASAFAFYAEAHAPATWDSEARKELGIEE